MQLVEPWTVLAPIEPRREYIVVVTLLDLRRWRSLPGFARRTAAIRRQLKRAPGAIGYTLRAKPLELCFWTLSVWRDAEAIRHFVGSAPHRNAMRDLRAAMPPLVSTRWIVAGSELPPSWDDSLAHLAA
jgi:heme-degrading monooxygenase HmoA